MYFHVWTTEITPHQSQIRLGNGEVRINRIESLNSEQHCTTAARISAGDNVANIDKSQTGATVDRRTNVAKIEIHLRGGDCCFRALHFPFVAVNSPLRDIQVLRRGYVSSPQFLLPFERNLIEPKLRFDLPNLALRLIERGLIRPRINRKKQIALLDIGTVLKVTRNDLPAHLRLDLDCFVGAARADFIEIKRHVLCDHFRNKHRSHWWL